MIIRDMVRQGVDVLNVEMGGVSIYEHVENRFLSPAELFVF